jgi:hypothetical protein
VEPIGARHCSSGYQPANTSVDQDQQPKQPAVDGERHESPSALDQQIAGRVLRSILRDRLSQTRGCCPGEQLGGLARYRIDVDTSNEEGALAAELDLRALLDIRDRDSRRGIRFESIDYPLHRSDRSLRRRISGDGAAHHDHRSVGDDDSGAVARSGCSVNLVRGDGGAGDSPESESDQ